MRARRLGFTRLLPLLTVAAVGLVLVAAGTAPANNRAPTTELLEDPGPGEISYGENVGYTATLTNVGSSTYTHLVYHHKVPTTIFGGTSLAADLVYSSCEPGPAQAGWDDFDPGDYYDCPARTLVGGAPAKVLTVWHAPGVPIQGDGVVCDDTLAEPPAQPINDCKLTSTAYWTMKEGTGNPGSAGPDTFPPDLGAGDPKVTELLGAAPDLTKARGYILDSCSSSSTTASSLATSVVGTPVGASNRLFTSVCATSSPSDTTFPLSPGLIAQIDETNPTGKGFPTAFVCIPAPPTSSSPNKCPAVPGGTGYTPWSFPDNPATPNVDERARFDFTIDNTMLPNGDKVDKVLHDDGTGEVTVTADCTIQIINSQKITKVSCKSATNGSWKFG